MKKLTCFIFLIVLFLSCAPEKELEIGFIADLSSGRTILGVNSRNAIQMAIDEINSSGGIAGRQVVLIAADNKNDPGQNEAIIEDFAQRGIKILIGPFLSRMVPSVLEASEGKDMLIISPIVSSDLFARQNDNFFRIMPNASMDGQQIGRALIKRGDKTAALIRSQSNDLYTQWLMKGVRETIRESGVEILYDYAFSDSEDLSIIADELKEMAPDALVFSALGSDSGKIIQLYGKSKEVPHIYTCEWGKNTGIDKHGGKHIQSMITVSTFNTYGDRKLEEEYLEKYYARYSKVPTIFSVLAYEVMLLLHKAGVVLDQDFTAEELKEYLLNLKGFQGVIGELSFDDFGDSQRLKKLYIYRDDRYEPF